MQNLVTVYFKDIRAKFGNPNLPQSRDTGQDSDGDISNFGISGKPLINENCHNSSSSDDIAMKLGPVTKLDRRNTTTFEDDVILVYCDVIVTFSIYSQFGEPGNRNPDTWSIIFTFWLIVTLTVKNKILVGYILLLHEYKDVATLTGMPKPTKVYSVTFQAWIWLI